MWPAVVVLLAAVALATVGSVVALGHRSTAADEAGAWRGITGLGLLTAAVALAAVGGALLGAGESRTTQLGIFAAAAGTVALPLLAVGLVRLRRPSG